VSPEMSPPHTIRFGEDLELDRRAYQLRRAGQALKLERIPFDILLLLIERRGHLVTREQIAERIWGKDVFLDVDNSINGAMRKIRQVLRDDSEHPRFIQTVTGRGYRFMAPAVETGEQPAKPATTQGAAVPAAPAANRWRRGVALALFVVAIISAGVWWARSRRPGGDRVMLAVLPFQNLTGDARQEYFSDGLTEEMITQLGNRDPEKLGVIARTSVMHYKSTPEPLDRIEAELGVQYVLTGSVRRDANTVRVTAQLVQAKDQTQIWARQYDRATEGLLTLQGEIATEITDEIHSRLGGGGRADGQEDGPPRGAPPASAAQLEAYDLYLRGEYALNQRTSPELRTAIRLFREATSRDPTLARAYAALADASMLLIGYTQGPAGDLTAQARAAVMKALQLDPTLPEAHTALALIVQNYDWDWRTAGQEFRQAIALNPNYATAHHWYAEHLMFQGRFSEALQESERARRLDPLSLIIASDNGAILLFSRQYDRAIDKLRSVLAIDPDFPRAQIITTAYLEKGMYPQALAQLERHRGPKPTPVYWSVLAGIYGRSGQLGPARQALAEMLRANRRDPVQAVVIAGAYIGVGEKDQAIDWLERAYAEHSSELVALKVHPAYDPLRGDPRFQRLLERVGLAP